MQLERAVVDAGLQNVFQEPTSHWDWSRPTRSLCFELLVDQAEGFNFLVLDEGTIAIIDQSYTTRHAVEEKLLKCKTSEVGVFDEATRFWTEITLREMEQRAMAETQGVCDDLLLICCLKEPFDLATLTFFTLLSSLKYF